MARASYFFLKIEPTRGGADDGTWRKRLFIATSYITSDTVEFLSLPRDHTVVMDRESTYEVLRSRVFSLKFARY